MRVRRKELEDLLEEDEVGKTFSILGLLKQLFSKPFLVMSDYSPDLCLHLCLPPAGVSRLHCAPDRPAP